MRKWLGGHGRERTVRITQAFFKMKKLDLGALERAAARTSRLSLSELPAVMRTLAWRTGFTKLRVGRQPDAERFKR
jgi:hypothetical protein